MPALPFIGVGVCNATEQRWTRLNDRLCAMLGYSRSGLLRRNWTDLCHPEDGAACREALERLLAGGGTPDRLPLRLRHAEGRFVAADVELSRIRGPRPGTTTRWSRW